MLTGDRVRLVSVSCHGNSSRRLIPYIGNITTIAYLFLDGDRALVSFRRTGGEPVIGSVYLHDLELVLIGDLEIQ